MCGKLFCEFQGDAVDHGSDDFDGGFLEKPEVCPVQRLAVADSAFGGDFQNVRIRERPDKYLQPAVFILRGAPTELNIVAADAGTLAFFVQDRVVIEAWKMVAQFMQTVFDVLRQIVSQ